MTNNYRIHYKLELKFEDKSIAIPLCSTSTSKDWNYYYTKDKSEVTCARCWRKLNDI